MKVYGGRTVGILLAVACLVMALGVFAQAPKAKPTKKNVVIVVVDMGKIYRESKLSKLIMVEMKAWDDGIRAQAQPKMDLMKQKQQALQDGQAKLSQDEKDKLTKEVQGLQTDLSTLQSKARQEYQEKQNEATQRMQSKLEPIIKALAEENGWDLVQNKADQNSLYSADALDQTDVVLAKFDAATPDTAAAAPPAPHKP